MAHERELLSDHDADLWAMSYGFNSADELKEWGAEMERERLAELASNKGAN